MKKTNNNCPHCGKKLKQTTSAFCTNCGTPLKPKHGQATATVHGGSLAKIVVNIPGEESREEFLSKPVTSVGRGNSNMIQILSATVSGSHAKIELTRKGHTVTDLNSTNGTFVNGKRINPKESHLLSTHDIIRFSDLLGNSASLTYVAPSGFSDILDVDISRPFTLTESVAYIGRNQDATFTLNHPAVSWYHAKVTRRDTEHYTIQDLSSHNGTFLNGTQLQQRKETPLNRGDVVQIGPFNLVYQDQGGFAPFSAERNFRLEAIHLEKTISPAGLFSTKNKEKTILRNLDLVINPREFVAVVGGSGTGKSTLIKALSGLSPASRGTVLVNGDDLYTNFNLYRTMMGYVPQDDIIHQGLEVTHVLRYAAQLRLPDANSQELKERTNDVLTKAGMLAHSHTLIKDLSGGQRKRVSIAVELLAEPWIFFLDEPTSGLDPGLEKLMMDTLRQLADEGRTIVLVTHATNNILNNCDQVVFMARGGELAYFGPPSQVTNFFKVKDFADIYTRLSQWFAQENATAVPNEIRAEYNKNKAVAEPAENNAQNAKVSAGSLWAEQYRKSALHDTYITNRQGGEIARPISPTKEQTSLGFKREIKQFSVLARRYLDLIRNDKISLWVLLAIMPIIGVLLLVISNSASLTGNTTEEIAALLDTKGVYTIVNQAQTLLFMMALSANLLGVFAASYEIIKEQAIYRRERMVNLKIFPYFASKFVVLGAFMLLQCLLLLIVLALKINFPESGAILWAPLEYYFTLVFTALASVALGLFISALASSQNMVIYLVLIALFLQIVFSGAIFQLSPLTQPISWLTITRWSLESLGSSTNMDALNNLGQIRVEREVDIGRGIQKVIEDVPTTINFYIRYTNNGLSLLSGWIFLWVHTLLWSSLTLWLIKQKDNI